MQEDAKRCMREERYSYVRRTKLIKKVVDFATGGGTLHMMSAGIEQHSA